MTGRYLPSTSLGSPRCSWCQTTRGGLRWRVESMKCAPPCGTIMPLVSTCKLQRGLHIVSYNNGLGPRLIVPSVEEGSLVQHHTELHQIDKSRSTEDGSEFSKGLLDEFPLLVRSSRAGWNVFRPLHFLVSPSMGRHQLALIRPLRLPKIWTRLASQSKPPAESLSNAAFPPWNGWPTASKAGHPSRIH